MSWFTDIAGKAEDFLNKIDQNAAIVLQTPDGAPLKSPRNSSTTENNLNSQINDQHDYRSLSVEQVKHENGTSHSNGSRLDIERKQNIQNSVNNNGKSSTSRTKSKVNNSRKKLGQTTGNSKKEPTVSMLTEPSAISITSSNLEESSLKITDNGEESDLIAFLNDSSRKDIDENVVLKTELTNQARELEQLFKNNKQLRSENDTLNTKLNEYEKKLAKDLPVAAGMETQLQQAEKVQNNLKSFLKSKDEEIDRLKRSLDNTLEKLQKVEVLQETQNKLEVIEMERNKLLQTTQELKDQINILTTQLHTSESHISSMKNSLTLVETEFTNYKEKAKSILKQKDDLIASVSVVQGIQEGLNPSESDSTLGFESPFIPEINALRSERELLNAEISQSRATSESLREDNRRLESELNLIRSMISQLQVQVTNEKDISSSFQDENLQFRQQISALQFDLEKERSERRKVEEFKSLQEKDGRRSPATEHRLNGPTNKDNEENLRMRITALSQSLLDKQSLINNLSSDKQLLQIHVERLQEQMHQIGNEVSSNSSGFSQTVISNQPLYLSESPWDSGMSMRVKRAFSTVDSLCCQAGLALRRRPNLRLGFCVYIILLHFWVFFILFHSFSHVPHPYLPPNGPAPAPFK